jgi:hypothetical protein
LLTTSAQAGCGAASIVPGYNDQANVPLRVVRKHL